jgi:hypothetical protein
MHRIALLHPTPTDSEIAILQVSNQEHDDLHKDALGFVNRNKVFCKDVRSVDLQHTPGTASVARAKSGAKQSANSGWIVTLRHDPSCPVDGSCLQV